PTFEGAIPQKAFYTFVAAVFVEQASLGFLEPAFETYLNMDFSQYRGFARTRKANKTHEHPRASARVATQAAFCSGKYSSPAADILSSRRVQTLGLDPFGNPR